MISYPGCGLFYGLPFPNSKAGGVEPSPGAFLGLLGMAYFGLSSGWMCWHCLVLSHHVDLCEAVLRSFLVLFDLLSDLLLRMACSKDN
jgi:hypothetical protein